MRHKRNDEVSDDPHGIFAGRSQQRYIAERNKMLVNLTRIIKLVDETPCLSHEDTAAIKVTIQPYLLERANALAPKKSQPELTVNTKCELTVDSKRQPVEVLPAEEAELTVNTDSELTVNPEAEPDTDPEPPVSEPQKRKKAQRASAAKIPTFSYPGGKARLAKRIAAMLPSGKRLVEPFAGRGNVYFYVASHGMYPSYWLNDIQTAPFLNTLRIGHILSVPKGGKESLYKYRAVSRDETKSPLARKHALLLEPYLCWNGGKYGQSGGTQRTSQAGFYEDLRLASNILRTTDSRVTRLDYREVLAQCGEGDVVYLDPPYLHANVKAYTDKTLDHREMVEILKNAKFKWVLSEYEQPLYIETLGKPALQIPVKRSKGKSGGGSKGSKDTVECFWTNFAVA
ncbi:MAG: DNA adenine methylase [Candidatus Acidiferrales bacterium]